jgi:hypothetical protein
LWFGPVFSDCLFVVLSDDGGFAAGVAGVLSVDLLSVGFVSTGVTDVPVAGGLLPPRKSVTYQPLPFNWKPAAVSCFLNVLLPHSGQSVSTGSDSFCSTSLAKPQFSQR